MRRPIYMNIYLPCLYLTSEHQARALIEEKAVPSPSTNSGSILNSKNSLESKQGSLGATFRNMQLKKIKRADRKGQEVRS